MYFLQSNYFFIITILSFLTGLSVCFAMTNHRIWPKGLILPLVGLLLTLQSVYLPIPGSDVLLIGGIAVMLLLGSALGLGARVTLRGYRARKDARSV